MTLDELQKNWGDYAIKFDKSEYVDDGAEDLLAGKTIAMREIFSTCLGYFKGGILFAKDTVRRKKQAFLLKCDENYVCYVYIYGMDFSSAGEWEQIGLFVKI